MDSSSTQSNSDLPWLAGAFFTVFVLFFGTMAPGLSWGNWGSDGGELTIAAAYLGVPHPSGYPFYLLLAHLFTYLPFGDLAFRTNFLSVTAGASVAAGCVWIMRLVNRRLDLNLSSSTIFFAGCAIPLGKTLWGQSLMTEVYSLHVALCIWASACFFAWHLAEREQRPSSRFFLAGILFGTFSLGVHLTALFFLPGLLLLVYFTKKSVFRTPRFWLFVFTGIALVIGLYSFLVWRASSNPPINWGFIRSAQDLFDHVSGKQYQHKMFSFSSAALGEHVKTQVFPLFFKQWGSGTNFFLLTGFLYMLYLLSNSTPTRSCRAVFIGGIIWISLFVPVTVYALGYRITDFEPYFALPFTLIGFFLLPAFKALENLAEEMGLDQDGKQVFLIFAECLLFLGIATNLSGVSLKKDVAAARLAQASFQALPKDSLILSDYDNYSNVLLYNRFLAHPERSDVAVLVRSMLGATWYRDHLRLLYPNLVIPEPPRALASASWTPLCNHIARKIIESNAQRPLFLVKDDPELAKGFIPEMKQRMLQLNKEPAVLNAAAFGPKYASIPIQNLMNSDYRETVFRPKTENPSFQAFFAIGEGLWKSPGDIPFWFFPSCLYSRQPSIFLPSFSPGISNFVPLVASPSKAIHLAGIGVNTRNVHVPIGILSIMYLDGTKEQFPLCDITDFQDSGFEEPEVYSYPIDETRIPFSLEFFPSEGNPPNQSTIAIFGLTQEFSLKP